jgi:hypothetical protein
LYFLKQAIVVTIFKAVQLILSFSQQCVCGKSFQNSVIVIAFLNHHHQCDSIFLSIIITMMVFSMHAPVVTIFEAVRLILSFSQQCVCGKSFQNSVTMIAILNHHNHCECIFSSIIITVILFF